MAAPVISSQALSDYAITTEEYTTASCVVTNTPTWIMAVANNIPFLMSQYSGTTYAVELPGYKIGLVSAGTITFIAVNGDGKDIEVAPSTLTVTSPASPIFGLDKVIERYVYLLKHPDEYGGNNVLTRYNIVKDFDGTLFNGNSLKMPVIWVHSLRDTVVPRSVDGELDIIQATIQFTVINTVSDTTNTKTFYDTEQAIRYLISTNPHLEIGDSASLIEYSKHVQTRFPEWDRGYFSNDMDIDIQVMIDTRS